MKITLKLVRVGMNMEDAVVSRWFKAPGDKFAQGEPLYAIETEKVTQDVESSAPGTLLEILVPAGGEVRVGEPVCVVDLGAQT